MFHASTTIRHNRNTHLSFAKEHRLAYAIGETLAAGASKVTSAMGKGWTVAKIATFPARMVLYPGWIGLKYGYKGVKKAILAGETPARTVKEAGIAIGKDTIFKPALTLALAPLEDVKINLVDQTRTVVRKGLIGVPERTFNRGMKIGSHARSCVSEILSLKPWQATKSFGRMLGNATALPFEPGVALGQMGYEMGSNIVRSKWQYATRFRDSISQVFAGLGRTARSYDTAKAETADRRAVVDIEEERKKEEKEAEKAASTLKDKEALARRKADRPTAKAA